MRTIILELLYYRRGDWNCIYLGVMVGHFPAWEKTSECNCGLWVFGILMYFDVFTFRRKQGLAICIWRKLVQSIVTVILWELRNFPGTFPWTHAAVTIISTGNEALPHLSPSSRDSMCPSKDLVTGALQCSAWDSGEPSRKQTAGARRPKLAAGSQAVSRALVGDVRQQNSCPSTLCNASETFLSIG